MPLTAPRIALALLLAVAAFGAAYAIGSAASGDDESSSGSAVTPFTPAESSPKVEGVGEPVDVPAMAQPAAPAATAPNSSTPSEPTAPAPAPAAPAPTTPPSSGGGGGGGGGGPIIEG